MNSDHYEKKNTHVTLDVDSEEDNDIKKRNMKLKSRRYHNSLKRSFSSSLNIQEKVNKKEFSPGNILLF